MFQVFGCKQVYGIVGSFVGIQEVLFFMIVGDVKESQWLYYGVQVVWSFMVVMGLCGFQLF